MKTCPYPLTPADDAFGHHLGFIVEDAKNGYARLRLNLEPYMINNLGTVHGGILATFCDEASGVAVHTVCAMATTQNLNIHYLKGAKNTNFLIAEAKPLHCGKRSYLYEINIYDDSGKHVTTATATYFILSQTNS